MKNIEASREKARKRVKQLKKFYSHLSIYIIINIVIFCVKAYHYDFFQNMGSEAFEANNWLIWDLVSTPVVWGIFLIIHAIRVFSHSSVEKWEAKQIQKYMEKEERDTRTFK
ncbi:MAG: 2TM domain-containing protein [Bacteroidota bacterium]